MINLVDQTTYISTKKLYQHCFPACWSAAVLDLNILLQKPPPAGQAMSLETPGTAADLLRYLANSCFRLEFFILSSVCIPVSKEKIYEGTSTKRSLRTKE